jgi:hypothetical protein
MLFGFAMGEIEPHHVHTGTDDSFHDFRGIGGGAEGGDYFCSAWHTANYAPSAAARRI